MAELRAWQPIAAAVLAAAAAFAGKAGGFEILFLAGLALLLLAVAALIIYLFKRRKSPSGASARYPKSNIRLCVFNASEDKKTLLWRITEKCNASCEYCFLKSNGQPRNKFAEIKDSIVENVIKGISENEIQKVIISGGEPLLVKNLTEIVRRIDSETACDSIAICTNGSRLKNNGCYSELEILSGIGKFKKFVVSVDHYDEERYKAIKDYKEEDFGLPDLINVIKKLKEKRFDVFVNVVATGDFLANPRKYVDFWRENEIKRLSISYPIKCDNRRKFKLKSVYDKIISGEHGDVSFLDEDGLELIIPDCEYEYCPHFYKKMFRVNSRGNVSPSCIEKPSAKAIQVRAASKSQAAP